MNIEALLDVPPWEWPRGAGSAFHKVLIDRQAKASDRLAAAELAGDLTVMNDDLATALLAILHSADEPEELRAKAAISFGPVLEEADIDQFEEPDDVAITERTFDKVQDSLHELYFDDSLPKEVRRRILEASVRAPQDWHKDAIGAAYSSGDREWMLTAVFAMRWVRGFDDAILEALKSADPEIHYEAVQAAGNWELDAAWPHIVALVEDPATPKPLLLAAISAVGSIRPQEAGGILVDLADSDDEDVADAADEAILMAEGASDLADEEEDDEDSWAN
jgi:hypothetical protein